MSESVFNEGSVDVDFRVEGNGATHVFFVEGETDRVGLLTNDPTHTLVVKTDSGGSTNVLKIEEKDSTDTLVQLSFGGDYDEGSIHVYNGGTSKINLRGNGASYIKGGDLELESDGARLFVKSADYELVSIGRAGSSGSALDQGYFRMKSAGSNKVAFHTAGDSYINGGSLGIGTDSPDSLLHAKVTTNTSQNIRIQNDDSMTTIGVSSDGYSFHTYQHSLYWASWDGSTWSTKARLDNDGQWCFGGTTPNIGGWNSNYTVLTLKGKAANYGGTLELANLDSTGNYFGSVSFVNLDGGSSVVAQARFSATRDGADDASAFVFETEPTGGAVAERMRIDSAGTAMFGTTTRTATGVGGASFDPNSVGRCLLLLGSVNYTSSVDVARFYNDNGEVGDIRTDGSGASFNSNSDYRLKENEVVLSNALIRLNNLKPYRFNFKADPNRTLDGFFAHEVQEVVPEAVTGTKDQMKAIQYQEGDEIPEGKEVYDIKEYSTTEIDPQKMDASKLVPLLVAAVQELSTKVTALEGN